MEEKIYSRKTIKIFNTKKSLNKEKSIKLIKIIAILIIAITTMQFIIGNINSIIDEYCIERVKSIATIICNEESTGVMEDYNYEDFSTVKVDETGKITMVKVDIIAINKIISDIPINIQKRLNLEKNANFNIQLGSLMRGKMFSGVGPKLNIKVNTLGNIKTNLISNFTSVGINQTLHRIYLQLDCEVKIATPYNNISESISNQVLLAETVIVGEIPNSYYNVQDLTTDEQLNLWD